MGCCGSRNMAPDKQIIKDITLLDLTKLSRAEMFELQIPLVSTDVEEYCRRIKDVEKDKSTLTVQQFLDAFSNLNDAWKNISQDCIFMQILNDSPLLKDSKEPNELSKNALMLWAIILCGGKSTVKVRAFYDIL